MNSPFSPTVFDRFEGEIASQSPEAQPPLRAALLYARVAYDFFQTPGSSSDVDVTQAVQQILSGSSGEVGMLPVGPLVQVTDSYLTARLDFHYYNGFLMPKGLIGVCHQTSCDQEDLRSGHRPTIVTDFFGLMKIYLDDSRRCAIPLHGIERTRITPSLAYCCPDVPVTTERFRLIVR